MLPQTATVFNSTASTFFCKQCAVPQKQIVLSKIAKHVATV